MTDKEKINKDLDTVQYCMVKIQDTLNHFQYLAWKESQPSRPRRGGSGVFGGEYCADSNFTGS